VSSPLGPHLIAYTVARYFLMHDGLHECPIGSSPPLPHVAARSTVGSWHVHDVAVTHTPPHSTCAGGHTHDPALHTVPPRHELPHAPQFLESVAWSTHMSPHLAAGDTHAHADITHDSAPRHTCPQSPQLLESCGVHLPPHVSASAGHPHVNVAGGVIVPPTHASSRTVGYDPTAQRGRHVPMNASPAPHAVAIATVGAVHAGTHVHVAGVSPAVVAV